MEKSLRKRIIAGNWKMNLTTSEAVSFVKNILADVDAGKIDPQKSDIVLCVPAIHLAVLSGLLSDRDIALGAQNIYFEDKGAFTGEISALMLNDLNVKYTIIGHSERREHFAEADETVNKKVLKAIERGITPIVCIGERLEQRDQGITRELVRLQAKIAFRGVNADDAAKAVIAYEPIWAIGTGRNATPEQAQEVCSWIRELIAELYGDDTASAIRIQYGGSVNAQNASGLFAMPDIDGGLVGGASIKAEFANIVNA